MITGILEWFKLNHGARESLRTAEIHWDPLRSIEIHWDPLRSIENHWEYCTNYANDERRWTSESVLRLKVSIWSSISNHKRWQLYEWELLQRLWESFGLVNFLKSGEFTIWISIQLNEFKNRIQVELKSNEFKMVHRCLSTDSVYDESYDESFIWIVNWNSRLKLMKLMTWKSKTSKQLSDERHWAPTACEFDRITEKNVIESYELFANRSICDPLRDSLR